MICPVCLEPMEPLVFFDTEVDSCRFCGGVWLDSGELSTYISRGSVPGRLLTGYCLDDSKMQVDEGNRKCPKCRDLMKVVSHKEVNVDTCPSCRGLWFDRGEILEIMKAYYQEAGPVKSSYSQPVKTSVDESGEEIIRIFDEDLAQLSEADEKSPESLTDVEREFLASGGKNAVAKAIPRAVRERITKKSSDPMPSRNSFPRMPAAESSLGAFSGSSSLERGGLMVTAILAFADTLFGKDSF